MTESVTSKQYWDEYWGEGELRYPSYDATRGLFYSIKLLLDDCFEKTRQRLNVQHLRVIDCGCGEGLILRFLAEQFDGLEIFGIEYSDAIGKAERMGRELGYEFNLIHGDLFDDWQPQYLESFDAVLSVGLIEHFQNPVDVLAQMRSALKPGGCLISLIPNFNGLFNMLWKLYDRDNYAYHIPIKTPALTEIHREVGLEEVRTFSMGLPTIPGVHDPKTPASRLIRRIVMNINGRLLRTIFPARQPSLDKQYPMASTIGCCGVK